MVPEERLMLPLAQSKNPGPAVKAQNGRIPVVCVGLSLGGLSPLKTIFQQLSPDTGMAFIVISHVSRTEPTKLPWLLSMWSKMPVNLARNGMVVKPNHIYVIPPGQEITVGDGHFAARPRSKRRGWSNVITVFLDSLVKSRKPAGVAVILSGMDADGAGALQEFNNQGGLTIVQDLESAECKAMPHSAIDTGFVDYVLPPQSIAARIEEIAKSFQKSSADEPSAADSADRQRAG